MRKPPHWRHTVYPCTLSEVLRWIAYRSLSKPLPSERPLTQKAFMAPNLDSDARFLKGIQERKQIRARIEAQMKPFETSLRRACLSGRLKLTGVRRDIRTQDKIPADFFAHPRLVFCPDPDGRGSIHNPGTKLHPPVSYYAIHANWLEVKALWPRSAKRLCKPRKRVK